MSTDDIVTYEAESFPSPQYLTRILKMASDGRIAARIKAGDTPERVIIDNTCGEIALVVRTSRTVEMARRTRTTGVGVRVTTWDMESGLELSTHVEYDKAELPDIINVGRVVSPEERAAKRAWEADCYRVGSASNPMDNAARCAEGYTTPAMARHWAR